MSITHTYFEVKISVCGSK